MGKNYYSRIFILFIMAYFLFQPIQSFPSALDEKHSILMLRPKNTSNITLETDWKNLIGRSFREYHIKFSNSLVQVKSEYPWFNKYKYQDSYIYVCQQTNRIHHVYVTNPNINVYDTHVGMLPYEIEDIVGTPTTTQESFITKKLTMQYAYEQQMNYNVALRCLTYTSSTGDTPITEIYYGYTLPIFPYKIAKMESNQDIRAYLKGIWISKDLRKLIFNENDPQSINNYSILSPNEISVTHISEDNYISIIKLHFIFNSDYNKLYIFSTDPYGIPILETIDEWTRSL